MDFEYKQIVRGQFEAALCMLNEAVQRCPDSHWEQPVTADSFRQVAYHTLFFVDYYLSTDEAAFQLRELHARGGNELGSAASIGLSREETLGYLDLCRTKMNETLASESPESFLTPSGFARRNFSRCELHLYNIRHVQHHTGQLSASLGRVCGKGVPWIGAGWR